MNLKTVPQTTLSSEEAIRGIQSKARYLFRTEEFAALTGRIAGGVAVKSALARLSRAGRIALVSKRPAIWLIVPAEHEHYGAPPVDWWLDDYLKNIEPGYYVALLSAARYWGSGHYARQAFQVMVGSQRPVLTVGRLAVEFMYKKNVTRTPVVRVSGAVSSLRVSTREATLLDLLRHHSEVGGLEAIVRIAKDFLPDMTPEGLIEALDALGQAPSAQRLGFLLEQLKASLAHPVAVWLKARDLNQQPLEKGQAESEDKTMVSSKWAIRYTQSQQQLIEELM